MHYKNNFTPRNSGSSFSGVLFQSPQQKFGSGGPRAPVNPGRGAAATWARATVAFVCFLLSVFVLSVSFSLTNALWLFVSNTNVCL